MRSRESVARTYYRSIDEGDYEKLAGVLGPSFVHERPDRTLEGPKRFIRFMREERPLTETTHELDALYSDEQDVLVRGRLVNSDEQLFGFVDVFSFEGTEIARLRTYTR